MAFTVVRSDSLGTTPGVDLQQWTAADVRGPPPAALAVWGQGFESPQLHPHEQAVLPSGGRPESFLVPLWWGHRAQYRQDAQQVVAGQPSHYATVSELDEGFHVEDL